jgi:hypothetical protein
MKFRILVAMFVLALSGLVSTPAVAAVQHAPAAGCTKTSSGSCIRGGQFCPQASYGRSGYDVRGRRYVCKGDRSHPHWMVP